MLHLDLEAYFKVGEVLNFWQLSGMVLLLLLSHFSCV